MVKKIKQKGGMMADGIGQPLYWDKGGTGGSIGTFVEDIIGIVAYAIDSDISGIQTIEDVVNLPSDMGKAFNSPNAPNPNSVNVPNI